MIDGRELPLSESDIFVVPAWASRRFRATRDLVLFSFSDRAAQTRLGLWRETLL
jgi:gentisate 1,2-dioxygenase